MKITPTVFEAYLKCPTTCWLRSTGEPSTGNTYSQWVNAQNDSYRATAKARLIAESPNDEVALSPDMENPKAAKWRLAVSVTVQAHMDSCVLESELHAIERVPAEGRGKPAQFIPTRFIFTNKLDKDDKLLLAFDAFALSKSLGREISLGKIIHGDDHTTQKVKTSTLASEVRKRLEKIAAFLSSSTPPDLVLNRHCAECEFQARCRQKAVEKDDLSLLSNMNGKERKELHSKGIYHYSTFLHVPSPSAAQKAARQTGEVPSLAEGAGDSGEENPHRRQPGTEDRRHARLSGCRGSARPRFLLSYRVRIGSGESAVQHSLWAETVEDEGKIWREFLGIVAAVEKPVLIHYGSYETTFLKSMSERHETPSEGSTVATIFDSAINLVSVMFAQIYFPTYSNGLKEVATWLRFKWSDAGPSGKQAIIWRSDWEGNRQCALKEQLVTYNSEDCKALALTEEAISRLTLSPMTQASVDKGVEVVRTDDLKHPLVNKWREFSSPLSELEFVNKAAHWDYQRDRIYVRSSTRLKRLRNTAKPDAGILWRVYKVVRGEVSRQCPRCMRKGVKRGNVRFKRIQEIVFGRSSLKRRVFRYEYQRYWCSKCKATFGVDEKQLGPGNRAKCGRSVHAYVFYHVIELYVPIQTVGRALGRLLGLRLNSSAFAFWKRDLAAYYGQTHENILQRIVSGNLVHADETHVSIRGTRGYVWVLTNIHEVAYLYSESREGEIVESDLRKLKGVLVSDFYAVYDSFDCPQQKVPDSSREGFERRNVGQSVRRRAEAHRQKLRAAPENHRRRRGSSWPEKALLAKAPRCRGPFLPKCGSPRLPESGSFGLPRPFGEEPREAVHVSEVRRRSVEQQQR
jgi:predicted RecB family nuclease